MAKYHMRRIEKEISNKEELTDILKNGKYTTISLCKENEPYIVTLSYGYDVNKPALYFHCAKEGQKIDFIKFNPNACGTVLEENGYIDGCGQAFRSVVYRGRMEIIETLEEKKKGLDILIDHLEHDPIPIKNKFLNKVSSYEKLGMLRLDITDISGKEEKAES
ncbi:MAG: pyridoxamine 5'-phosphate oxidase family protein [Promethearchaeota archaeon]